MSSESVIEELHGVVDRLAALDADALDAAELGVLVVAVERERSRLAVAVAGALHAWERAGQWEADGSLRPQLALGRDTRRDHRLVRRDLRRARMLARMPHTRAAVLAGRLSLDHVDLFLQHATAARFELFLESEAWLVERCVACPLFDDARREVHYWAQWADDQLGLGRDRPRPSTLYASRAEVTGEWLLDGHLSAIDGEIVTRELRRLARQIQLDDRQTGLTRTPAQRRAAALVRMATRSVNATGVTARPLFEIIVGDETARHLCQLASGTVVHPDDLTGHLDAAVMEVFLFGGQNTVLAVSRQRTFRGALRRAIQVRDRRCQHDSVCPTPADVSDIDHRTPAARGGPTSQFNGRVGCVPHNRLAHLHDHPDPVPERPVTTLDTIRCRLRWRYLRDEPPDQVESSG